MTDAIDLGSIRTDDRPFRFLHAADLHLGASEHVQAALRNMVSTALDRDVDAVMLAGDIYDSAERSPNLQSRFLDALRSLDGAGVHVFIAHGNHDPSVASFRPVVGELPGNVHVFQHGDPQTYLMGAGHRRVAVTGVSFSRPHETTNLAALIAGTTVDADLRVAVLHANVAGQPGHDDYGPCTQDDLRNSDIHYWALGHIHKRTVTPMGHGRWWVYPGNLQGRSTKPSECGAKGAVIVTAAATGFDEPEFVPCDVHRFVRVDADLSDVVHFEDAVDTIVGRVNEVFDEHRCDDGSARGVTVRLRVAGATEVHGEIGGLEPGLLADRIGNPRVVIDKVVTATGWPVDRAALAGSDTLVGALLRRVDELRLDPRPDDDLLDRVSAIVGTDAVKRTKELLDKEQIEFGELLDRVEARVLDELAGSEQ